MKEKWLLVPVVAVFAVLLSVSVVHAALTFTSTAVTSDGAITLTTGAVSTAVTVTYGINANAATSSATTTPGLWVSKQAGTASTTTLQIGGMDENGETHSGKSCIQMWRGNRPSKVYLDAAGTALVVAVGTCSDT